MSIIGGAAQDPFVLLITDPEGLRAEYTRLKEATEEAQKVIATAGDIKQIGAMRAQAQQAIDDAQRVLSDASDKANHIVEAGKAEAGNLIAKAKSTVDVMKAETTAAHSVASAERAAAVSIREMADREATAMKRDLAEKIQDAEHRERSAADAKASADSAKAVLDEKLDRVRKVMVLAKEAISD